MSKITLGIGMSHTPRLVTSAEDWLHFGSFAQSMGGLIDVDGEFISAENLTTKYGNKYAAQTTLDAWRKCKAIADESIDKLAEAVKSAELDAIIVLGDDQHELLTRGNYPSILIPYSDTFKMVSSPARAAKRPLGPIPPEVLTKIARGWHMDDNHSYPNHAPIALKIIEAMMANGLSPAVSNEHIADSDPARGVGHAFGIVISQILREQRIPLIPIVLNTYFPPNQPTPDMCWQIGRIIHDVVANFPGDLKVGIVASGGLSHFIVDEEWDAMILDAMRKGDPEQLKSLDTRNLQSGNSEVLCWIVAAAACQGLTVQWDSYAPVYSTPAREGVAFAFMQWG